MPIADTLIEQQLQDGRVESQLRREAWAVLALLETELFAALKLGDPTQYALLASGGAKSNGSWLKRSIRSCSRAMPSSPGCWMMP